MDVFLQDLFADAVGPASRLVVFTAPDKRWRRFTRLEQAASYIRRQSGAQDVYFAVGLVRGNPAGRGTAADVAAIGALWADIDLAGDAHPGKSLPATEAEARSLLDGIPLPASRVVHTGNGLHAYWLLKEPWVFAGPDERDRAASLARGWHALVCSRARERGWSLENLGDLARILRPPGTRNLKNAARPLPVRLIHADLACRYDPGDFEPFVREQPACRKVSVNGAYPARLDAAPPADKLAQALAECPLFQRTWQRQRTDLADPSQSGYDLSLASIALLRGWTEPEVAALIVAHRREHEQNPSKALREDYMRKTIDRARSAVPPSPAEAVDLSRLMPRPQSPVPPAGPPDPGPLPGQLLEVPGFVGEVIACNLATAIRPQPVLALAGALCLQSVLAARKVRDERGNRTNLYIVGVAPSGGGKDHARKVNRNALFQAGLDTLEGNEDLASDAGLVAAVEAQPAVLFQLDEFGRFLRTVGDAKKSPHLYNVLTTLMKLYSSADTIFRGKAYADPTHNRTIDQPCVSVYGTSVPEHFYEALTAEALQDGFVARLLVFEGANRADRRRVRQQPIPEAILEAARWWGEFTPRGNLAREHPAPLLVETTVEAGTLFDGLAAIVDQQCGQADAGARSLWARAEEKACRLALVHACSADRLHPVVDAPAARWACELSEYLTRRMLFLAHQWVADGSFDARQKKVLRVIREAGGEIGHSELYNRTRSLTPRDRQEVLENLKQTGQIDIRTETTSTRPGLRYVLR